MPYGPGSARTTPLPANWRSEIRPRILARDHHACQWKISFNGQVCGAPATDVDHIGNPEDHGDENLRALCGPHHRRRSSSQGGYAKHAKTAPRRRPGKQHPGLL